MDFKEYKKQQLANDDFRKEYQKQNLRFETSQLITEARLYKNLSQKDLAGLVGTRQPSIARIESGVTLPSLSFLERIAEALGTYLVAPKFGFMIGAITETFDIFHLEKNHANPVPKFTASPYFTRSSNMTETIRHA